MGFKGQTQRNSRTFQLSFWRDRGIVRKAITVIQIDIAVRGEDLLVKGISRGLPCCLTPDNRGYC